MPGSSHQIKGDMLTSEKTTIGYLELLSPTPHMKQYSKLISTVPHLAKGIHGTLVATVLEALFLSCWKQRKQNVAVNWESSFL